MIVRLALSALFLLIALVALAGIKEHRTVSRISMLLCALAVAAVWMDGHVIELANRLGVGRGTDLVLYLLLPLLLLAVLVLTMRIRKLERQQTLLSRAVALGQARPPTA
jgi:hypothetical protein